MVAAKKSVKKTTAKKTAARKPVAAKKKTASHARSSAKTTNYKTFQLATERHFLSMQITSQTVYWLILLIFIAILQTIILFQEINIMNILSQTAAL